MTDAESFKKRYIPLGRMMFAEALRILGDAADAEDVVQDIFVRLWERREALSEVGNVRAYTLAMVRNRCLSLVCASAPATAELSEAVEAAPDGSESLDRRDRVDRIMGLIESLPDKQRLVITMHDVEGCPYSEIESSTGLSADNVRQLLSRARRFIRSHFYKD